MESRPQVPDADSTRRGGRRRDRRPPPPRELLPTLKYRLIGLLGAALVRIWGATLRIEFLNDDHRRAAEDAGERVAYAFWHGILLPLAYTHRGRGIVVLVSRHGDGEIISQIVCRLGYGVVRGSSTRGGARAMVEMARAARAGHPLAVTPDGPRGPRRELQPGLLHIAHRGGVPIVPVALEALRRTELSSWDRFLIPHPFSRVAIATGPKITIPAGVSAQDLESEWAPRVAAALRAVCEAAAAWRAAHGKASC